MPKQIIGETFEQLGKTVGQAVKQAAQEPVKIIETATSQVGIKPQLGIEQPAGQTLTPAQQVQKREETKRKLTYLEEEVQALRAKQPPELPKQVTGKPGFPEEKAIKQLEMKEEGKKELPPIATAKQKARAVEIKKMGISG